MTAFAPIGAAGYVASRHMKAMQVVGGDRMVAYDPNDSVGILDSYFPDRRFFTEFERFDWQVNKLRHRGDNLDYVSICSPDGLEAILFALHGEVFPFGGLLVSGIHGKGA